MFGFVGGYFSLRRFVWRSSNLLSDVYCPGMLRRVLAIVLAVVLSSRVAHAWSYKEHVQLTRITAMRLLADEAAPARMKDWLRESVPVLPSMDAEKQFLLDAHIGPDPDRVAHGLDAITWWVCVPDIESNRRDGPKVPPFDQHERLNHYFEVELFMPGTGAKPFKPDLSNKPRFGDVPLDPNDPRWVRAGYLPLATEHAYRNLVRTIRAGKLRPDPARPDDADHAHRWAGYLLHYTQDATQPMHASVDYKAASAFPRELRNPPNVHAEFEWKLVDDPDQPLQALREDYWKALLAALEFGSDPIVDETPFDATVRTSLSSYDAMPLIVSAASNAWSAPESTTAPTTSATSRPAGAARPGFDTERFYRFKGRVREMELRVYEMKAIQHALAIRRGESLLRQAWIEAGK
jgi:hypothetical protein